MSWDLEGKHINGMYMGKFPYQGVILSSRVKFGGDVQHTVRLNEPILVYGAVRDVILVDDMNEVSRILDECDLAYYGA